MKMKQRDVSRKIGCLLLTGIILTAVSGCVTVTQPPAERILGTKTVSDKNYVIGKPESTVVGGDVIRVKDYSVTEVAEDKVDMVSDFRFSGPTFNKHFTKGEEYPFAGTTRYDNKDYDIMRIGRHGLMFDQNGVVIDKLVNNLGGRQPVVMVYTFDVVPNGPHLRQAVKQRADSRAAGANYEIIFTGITPESIRMTYREYTPDDMARPAFSQDLTYPINSNEIRFRKLVIKILAVTPDHLRYEVLKD